MTGVAWEGTFIAGPGQRTIAAGGAAGKATVIFTDDNAVYARSQV